MFQANQEETRRLGRLVAAGVALEAERWQSSPIKYQSGQPAKYWLVAGTEVHPTRWHPLALSARNRRIRVAALQAKGKVVEAMVAGVATREMEETVERPLLMEVGVEAGELLTEGQEVQAERTENWSSGERRHQQAKVQTGVPAQTQSAVATAVKVWVSPSWVLYPLVRVAQAVPAERRTAGGDWMGMR
jgi:hypothetical protein